MKKTQWSKADPETRAIEIDETWVPIEMALNRNDALKAVDLYDAATGAGVKSALRLRCIDYLTAKLALPRDAENDICDDQGLYRLQYMICEKLPARMFAFEQLPELFDAMPEYWRRYPWTPAEAATDEGGSL